MFGFPVLFIFNISSTNLICKTPENITQILKSATVLPSDIVAIMGAVKSPFWNDLKEYSGFFF